MATDHMAALDDLAKLKAGWLLKDAPEGVEPSAETGLAPTKESVKAARAFMRDGRFYPTPVGGVQWEADAGEWAVIVTFNPDGSATIVYGAQS